MTGFVFAMSPCVGCGLPFAYNPHKVPSLMLNGQREPICLDCVQRANPERLKNGLAPIVPQDGAYESMPEEEL